MIPDGDAEPFINAIEYLRSSKLCGHALSSVPTTKLLGTLPANGLMRPGHLAHEDCLALPMHERISNR